MKIIRLFMAAAAGLISALPIVMLFGATGNAAGAEPTPESGAVVAVDWKSIEHSDGLTEVWVTNTFARTITLGHGLYPHRSQRLHYAIDCEQYRFAISQWLLTDDAVGAGQVVWSGWSDTLRFSTPWPDSLEDHLVAEACRRRPGIVFAQGIGT